MSETRIKSSDYQLMKAAKKPSKYRNKKTVFDGVLYDSKAEANFAAKLKIREQLGEVKDVERQVVLAYELNGKKIFKYMADFVYFDVAENRKKYIDVKGFKTPVFKLKAKILEAALNIKIECVKG